MTLAPGTVVGPYEITGPLGSGGMGEVYRARDARLAREVALKVLPASFLHDPDRLRRFEQEARAAGQLNHPNIVVVYDTGTHAGAPYVVEELLEGETLRQRLGGGRLPPRKVLDYARQIAQGLAAAHHKGIVHRDLKPENLFVTTEGRLKILDFGLAKLARAEVSAPATQAPTQVETGAGVVLGTVGYMSPEQVRGQPADPRSDLFSFGAILYEMLTGRRPFEGPSSVETMNAILHTEPPPLSPAAEPLPPGLERILQHCLEKRPDERFQSARDLAFQLESLSSPSAAGVATPAVARRAAGRVPWGWTASGALAGVMAATALWLVLPRGSGSPTEAAVYQQLTFRQETIDTARFTPDGQSVVYSSSLDGGPSELSVSRPGSPETRPLGVTGALVLSISRNGEMALLQNPRYVLGFMRSGTLARVPLAGGAPRAVLEGVEDASWSPSGELAVARHAEGVYRLEYPIGKVLYETRTWIGSVSFSPDGRHIAFVDHPRPGDSRGRIAAVDLSGHVRFLTEVFNTAMGLAWRPDGREIWFTAGLTGNVQALYAVDMGGSRRLVDGAPANLRLHDISPQGKVLVARDLFRRGIIVKPPGGEERDLSWFDWSRPAVLSRDGAWLLYDEQGQGGGPSYSVYLRRTDGSPPVRLGSGYSCDLSPDGSWAASIPLDRQDTIVLLPTGAGTERTFTLPGFALNRALFLPDGRLVALGSQNGKSYRLYVLDDGGGNPRAISPEGPRFAMAISPDGRHVAASLENGGISMHAVDGSGSTPVAGGHAGDDVAGWSADGKELHLLHREGRASRLERLEVATGRTTPWITLSPADRSGLLDVGPAATIPDGTAYVYTYRRLLSALYVVAGLS
jgi:Tol biopolymer transport system component